MGVTRTDSNIAINVLEALPILKWSSSPLLKRTLYQVEALDPYVQALLHTDMKLGAQLTGKGGNTSPNNWWFMGNRTWQLGGFVSSLFGFDGVFLRK